MLSRLPLLHISIILILSPLLLSGVHSIPAGSSTEADETASGNGTDGESGGSTNKTGKKPPVFGEIIGKKSEKFNEALMECVPKLPSCHLLALPGAECALSCILDPHPVNHLLIGQISQIAERFCSSALTIYSSGVERLLEEDGGVRSPRAYLQLLNIPPYDLNRFSHLSAEALPSQLIRFGRGSVFRGLRGALLLLDIEASTTFRFSPKGAPPSSSPALLHDCGKRDLSPAIMALGEAFTLNPAAIDVALPGFFTLNTLMTLPVSGLFSEVLSLIQTIYLLSGLLQCSVVSQGLDGGKRVKGCEEGMGALEPRFTRPLPPSSSQVCLGEVNKGFVELGPLFPEHGDWVMRQPGGGEGYNDVFKVAPAPTNKGGEGRKA